MNIMRRAIGADGVICVAHVDENMRMIERGEGAHAHEFLGADPDTWDAGLIVEMRGAVVCHRKIPFAGLVGSALFE
jgi:hypothetical protein